MSDLIDRAAAIEICDDAVNFWDGTSGVTGIWSVRNEIAKLEPAQPDLESAYAEGYTAAEAEFHKLMDAQESDVARDIATIIENERDMRVILKNAEHTETHSCEERTETHESRREWYMKGYRDAQNAALHESCTDCPLYDHDRHSCPRFNKVIPTAILDAQQPRWIPCEERLPEDLEAVNITWVNHEPEPYYHDIKDKNFVATGIHYRDKWYWYSTTCADFLGEYGSNEVDEVDDAVEIIAWMPLPPSYKGDEDE